MEDRSVFLTMARPAAHGTLSARTRPAHHATQRPSLVQLTKHEPTLPPASHAVPHCTMAFTSHQLQCCTFASILLGCGAVRCQAFTRHILARLSSPLSGLAALSCIFFCCHALHIAFGVLVSLQCWLRKLLVLLPILCIGPPSARLRVAARRHAVRAARHVSEKWPLALQPRCL